MASNNASRLKQCESDIHTIKEKMVKDQSLDEKLGKMFSQIGEQMAEQRRELAEQRKEMAEQRKEMAEQRRTMQEEMRTSLNQNQTLGEMGSVDRPIPHRNSALELGGGIEIPRRTIPTPTPTPTPTSTLGGYPSPQTANESSNWRYRLTEEEKVEAAVVGLDGDALLWYQWENLRRTVTRWSDLKDLMLKHFRSTENDSLYEQWLAVTQENTVEEYRRRFIQYAAHLERVTEEMMLATFTRGLKARVRSEVRVLDPKNLEEAMKWAVRVEAKLNVGQRGRIGGGEKMGLTDYQTKFTQTPQKITQTNNSPSSTLSTFPGRFNSPLHLSNTTHSNIPHSNTTPSNTTSNRNPT